ncbi:DUF3927 family protein [Klebsiella pneumoniae]
MPVGNTHPADDVLVAGVVALVWPLIKSSD